MSPQRTGYLGLGSNVGDRRAHLRRPLAPSRPTASRCSSSSTYDTDPVGEILDQPSFLNACLRIATALEPEGLLDLCKALERELGRTRAARHAPRPIDIDLLLLGELELPLAAPDGCRTSRCSRGASC